MARATRQRPPRTPGHGLFALLLATAMASSSCSLVSQMAVSSLADTFAAGEAVFRSDDDLELVGAAMASNLKLLETILASSPEHRGMLLSAAKGFLLYGYGFVEPQRFQLDFTQFEEEQVVRRRAARIYERAANYGMRGLEANHPGIADRLRVNPDAAVAELEDDDAGLALWTGTALGALISMSADDPEATADIAVMGALLYRSRELDDTVDNGVVYDYLAAYEVARVGGSIERAREFYEAGLEVGKERLPVLWSTWAESGSIAAQDRNEFVALLEAAVEFDIDSEPDGRLLNRIAQVRAAWLLENADDYFLDLGNDLGNQDPGNGPGRTNSRTFNRANHEP